ncbi:hypothetical protein [Mycolicibacterium thermoresistibile]
MRPAPDVGDLESASNRFDAAMARARDRVEALDRAADELAAVRGHAVSPCGRATAEVDHTGRLAVLRLTSAVTRLAPVQVGELIVDTVAAAARDRQRRRSRTVADLVDQLGGIRPSSRPDRNCAGRQYAHRSGPNVG